MTNRKRNTRFNKHRQNTDRFKFTNDLNLIKPYADYDGCIEDFIFRFGPNDVIIYNKDIGFALIQYNDFCPLDIQDDPYCLYFIYIKEDQRGKGHGRRLMQLILKHFQIVIHSNDPSLGFYEHISKDLGLEKINTGLSIGNTFISTNLQINRTPTVNSCVGGCGRRFSGYKRHACPKCSMRFVVENTDKELIELNNSLRSKLKKEYQPSVFIMITPEVFTEMMISNINPDFKRLIITDVLRNN